MTYPELTNNCKLSNALLLLIILVASHGSLANTAVISGRASVIDADTLEIHGQRIRLFGIDAIESRQTCTRNGKPWRCGQAAAMALDDWIGQQTVSCNVTGTDRWKRKIARCYVHEFDMQAWLVANGWAMAFTRYSKDYVADQERAQKAGVGIWGAEFQEPWEWRQQSNNR